MQDTAASAAYPGYVPQFDYDPQPPGYEGMSPSQQAGAAAGAWDTMRNTARTNEHSRDMDRAQYAMAAVPLAYGASRASVAASNALRKSNNRWVKGVGTALRFGQAGLGNVSRWVANFGLKQKAGDITTAAGYIRARKPGFWAAAARTPMHFIPDPSVPYAAYFGNKGLGGLATRAVNNGATRMGGTVFGGALGTAGVLHAQHGLAEATGDHGIVTDPSSIIGNGLHLMGGGLDAIPYNMINTDSDNKFRETNVAGLNHDYDPDEFDRLYRNNLHDMQVLGEREDSNRRAAQSIIGLLLGGAMGGIPGAGAGAGLPYFLNQLSNKYPTQYAPWSGEVDDKGRLGTGVGGNIQVGADTFDYLRNIANTTRRVQ